MAKKQPTNQLGLDYTSRGNRIVHVVGEMPDHNFYEATLSQWRIMDSFRDEMHPEIDYPHEMLHQISPRLPFPESVEIIQIQTPNNVIGFSAISQKRGLLFIDHTLDTYHHRYYSYLLAATLGLNRAYPTATSLHRRAEELVLEALVPSTEIESFFKGRTEPLSPALALDITDYFRIPFPIIVKRAHQLGILTADQFNQYSTIKPALPRHSGQLFVTESLNDIDDLENYLFGDHE